MRLKSALLPVLAAAFVASAALAQAQRAAEPAIGGYCPVAYQAANMAQKGDATVTSTYQGQTFYLTNAMVKGMFDKDPAKYTPAYEGYCAAAVAKGMKLASNPELFTVEAGKTYLFSSAEAKGMFDKDKANMVKMANANWPKVARMAVSK